MTQKVNPSPNRRTDALPTGGAIAVGGGAGDGLIIPGNEVSQISARDADIDDTALNAFQESSSASSFDVTFDPGEGFVYGSWVVKDTSTTVTLSSSTTGQTVYLGWELGSADTPIIGLDGAFSGGPRIPIYDFDTDGSGVTAVTDRRRLGSQRWKTVTVSSDYNANNYEVILADASGGALTVTLPEPNTDVMTMVKKVDASNDVTIATPESQTIDGASNFVINTQYASYTITSDGSNYFIV